ncbi:MAG: response regulator [Phycisphaerae bacterium]|jgi:CheY-like chemotaxis protein
MPSARVLDVGNCDPDHGLIRGLIEGHFDAAVDRRMFVHEAIDAMHKTRYDLVLVNRQIFADQSDGLELVRRARSEPELDGVPIMMVSNYDDAQQRAVAAGAVHGFGKARLGSATTLAILERYLRRQPGGPSTETAVRRVNS